MRRFKLSAVLPILVVMAALGLSAFGTSGQALAAQSVAEEIDVEQGDAVPDEDDRRRAEVGSGRENYTPYEARESEIVDPLNFGQELYITACSSCHGLNLEGSPGVPSLIGVGAASVDFYVSSGRMPADAIYVQAPRKDPIYTRAESLALAEYVAQYGGVAGPPIPEIDPESGDVVEGNVLYANNCAACHNSNGSGGALAGGYWAPPLNDATPLQVAEAIRVGPGAMPAYGPETFTDQQVNSLVLYVEDLHKSENPGGLPLGHLGPVPEGFFAWVVGLGLLLAVARWIGTRV